MTKSVSGYRSKPMTIYCTELLGTIRNCGLERLSAGSVNKTKIRICHPILVRKGVEMVVDFNKI